MRHFIRRHRKLVKFSIFFIFPLMLYAGAKLYLWYATKSYLDNFSQRNAATIQMNYGSISTSLSGEINIEKLKFFLVPIKESFSIDSVSLKTTDLKQLITTIQSINKHQLPDVFTLDIKHMRLDLKGQLFASEEDSDENRFKRSGFGQFYTLACGNVRKFDGKALKEMGYNNIDINLTMDYQYNPTTEQLALQIDNKVVDFYSVSLNLNVHDLAKDAFSSSNSSLALDNMPQLGKLKISFMDELFGVRKSVYCAKQNNSDKDNYIKKHLAMAYEFMSKKGIYLNDPLKKAYKTIVVTPGTIDMEMNFSDISNPMQLLGKTPNEIFSMINFQLTINEKKVEPLSLKIDFNKLVSNVEIKIKDDNIKKKHIKRFHTITKNQLSKYQNYLVRIDTHDGEHFEGNLILHDRFNVEVRKRTKVGAVSHHIQLSEIKESSVYY